MMRVLMMRMIIIDEVVLIPRRELNINQFLAIIFRESNIDE